MGFYADPWLREARDKIKFSADRPSQKSTEMDHLADAIEKAIKAALIECHGSIPPKHDHKKLVSLCQATGVWEVLPPALKNLVQEVESCRFLNTANTAQTGGALSSPQQLQKYFSAARRLIDYVEYHVIGNDSVLKRLTVD
jgi:HEPN domain-containing protein